MDNNKEYYAFISYKRKDKKEAKQLQHALEYYRLPNHLRQENPELPEYVRPVFRDMTDLEVGELSAQIHSALEQSHFLIVVCSPRAAASKWVNDEVEYFISLGKQDKIIPYIIEGVPHASNLEEECYPPSLLNLSKEKELLGANINEVGRDSATIRVVSRMFNIRFDTLYQRYEREQKRKRWMWIGGSIIIALLGLSIGGYFVRQNGIIERQNERLLQDSIAMADHLRMISAQNDSIASQNNLISSQRDSIELSIQQLQLSNKLLAEERDNVRNANNAMKLNLSRILAGKASVLDNQGDSYRARKIAVAALKTSYTPEAERALRLSSKHHTSILKDLTDNVNSICFSFDGQIIAAASANGMINIWDCETGLLKQTLYEDKYTFEPVYSVAFNKDANRILCLSYKGVSIRDVNTGYRLPIIEGNKKQPICATYSPVEEIIAIAYEDEIVLYNAQSAHMVNSFHIISDVSNNNSSHDILQEIGERKILAFSPDGKYMTAVNGNKLNVYDLSMGRSIKEFYNETGRLYSVAYDQKGEKLISVGEKGIIIVWEIANDLKKTFIDTTSVSPNYALFCPSDEYLAIHSELTGIHLYNMSSGKLFRTFRGTSCSFSPAGDCIAIGSREGDVYIHEISEHRDCLSEVDFSSNFVHVFAISPDCETMALWDGIEVLLVNYYSGKVLDTLKCSEDVREIQFSPNGRLLVAIAEHKTIEWDLLSKELMHSVSKENDLIRNSLALHYYTKREASAFRNTITLKNTDNGKVIYIETDYERTANTVSCLAFSAKGDMLVSCSKKGQIDIWDVYTGKHIKRLIGEVNSTIKNIYFTNSNKYIVVSTWNKSYVFDFYSGSVIYDDIGDLVLYNEKYNQFLLRDWRKLYKCDFPSIEEMVDYTDKRFSNNPLTAKERRKYNLE